MSILENLKLAIKVSSIIAIGAGTFAFTATRPQPADAPSDSIEVTGELVSETASMTTKLSATTTAKSTTTSTTSTTSMTSTTATTVTEAATEPVTESVTEPVTESVAEPVTESVTEAVEVQTELELAGALKEEQPVCDLSAGSLIRSGMRGTYYTPGGWNGYSSMGGSGRDLLDCSYGGDGYAKGSIASGYLYDILGYSSNGSRTAVWLEISGYSEMSGIYYLDDCSGADVIDFFYDQNSNCQFYYAGVVSVDVYYVN